MTWGAIGGAAVSLIGGALLGSGSSGNSPSTSSNPVKYDPYGPYRQGDAQQLQSLMKNPSSAVNSSYGQALQLGASRAMAAQGYTGSGNAIIAAANAGGQAYEQQFNNLAMTSGAGQNPAYAQAAAANQGNINQQGSNQMWNQLGGIASTGINAWNNSNGSTTNGVDSSGGTGYYDIGGNGTGGLGMQTQTDQSTMYAPSYASTDF